MFLQTVYKYNCNLPICSCSYTLVLYLQLCMCFYLSYSMRAVSQFFQVLWQKLLSDGDTSRLLVVQHSVLDACGNGWVLKIITKLKTRLVRKFRNYQKNQLIFGDKYFGKTGIEFNATHYKLCLFPKWQS